MAYIKTKFFEHMCSECFYLIDQRPMFPDTCPNCGAIFTDYQEEYDDDNQ